MHFAIHIGFHKCASTFLQEQVFPRLPVNYVHLSSYDREDLDYLEHSPAYDPLEFRRRIQNLIGQSEQNASRDMTLLSQEELSGHLHGHVRVDREKIALRLHETFPQARILMIIRNPFEYMKSLYSYSVNRDFERRSFHDFIDEEGPRGLFDKLSYIDLIRLYSSLFGTRRVLVLPVELLKSAPSAFLAKITEFLDLSPVQLPDAKASNTTIKNRRVLYLWTGVNHAAMKALRFLYERSPKARHRRYPFRRTRRLSFHIKNVSNPILCKLLPDDDGLSFEDYSDYDSLFRRYGRDTMELSEITGLTLRDYGYPGAIDPAPSRPLDRAAEV